jgi:hypothetical protein
MRGRPIVPQSLGVSCNLEDGLDRSKTFTDRPDENPERPNKSCSRWNHHPNHQNCRHGIGDAP